MGTCYSRKITSEDLYYSNPPMDPPKSGIAPRSIRSSPYNRNVADSCGLALKKRPLSTSKLPHLGRLNFASEKHNGFSENVSLSSNLNKNRPSKLHILVPNSAKSLGRNKISPSSPSTSSIAGISQINQENKTLSPINASFIKSKPDTVDSNLNKCNSKKLHMTDNNDNLSSHITYNSKNYTISPDKSEQDVEKSEEVCKKTPSVSMFYSSSNQCYSEPAQNTSNQSNDKENDMGDRLQKFGLPIRTFPKPFKLTSFISGIRKPQERHPKEKVIITSDMPQKKTGTIEERLSDNSCNVVSTKDVLKDEKLQQVEGILQPKKNQSDSQSPLNSQETCINSSGKHRDRDSGLGNSFSEVGTKAEDSDTLKDAERFSSFEGSPVLNKSYELSLENLKLQNSATSIQATYRQFLSCIPSSSRQNEFQGNASAYRSDKKENRIQKPTRISENSFPQSYGSYRGILAYRKIPPMKFDGQTNWKKFQSPSSQNTKRSYLPSDLLNIPKPAISKCEKQISTESQVTVIATTSEKTREDGQWEKIDSENGLSSLLLQSCEREKGHMSTSQVSQNTTDSTFEEQSCFSSTCESDNREFLIDDEIADQPGLVTFGCGKYYPSGLTSSLQESVTELSALQENWNNSSRNKNAFNFGNSLKSCSDIGSSCSSLASDDMMLDFEASDSFDIGSINTGSIHRRKGQHRNANTTFNNTLSYDQQLECKLRAMSQPTPVSFHYPLSESDDGSVKLDVPTYKLICQDMNSIKTQLLHLKSVLHEAETLNPFETSTAENVFYQNLVNSDLPSGYLMGKESIDVESPQSQSALKSENSDLRRQVILLQEQLEEKDCVIRLLQQQMTECTAVTDKSETLLEGNTCNAATQTERVRSWISGQNSELSYDDSSSTTLVSIKMKISSQGQRKPVDIQKKKDEKWKTARVRRHQSVNSMLMSSQC